jgi:uncharacterized repeat protein (TIGR03803 family)
MDRRTNRNTNRQQLSLIRIADLTILAAITLAFALPVVAQTGTVLYNFDENHKNPAYPRAGLISDKAGNFYGTTTGGGTGDGGSVFEMRKKTGGGWSAMVLHSFFPPRYGADLISSLIMDSAGNLYGTTELGGATNNGTVFEMVRQPGGGWIEKTLHSFSSTEGHTPIAGVIMDSAGNLYGTTVYGGSGTGCLLTGASCGTVVELSPQSDGTWTETILHNFANDGTDGVNPYFGLVFDGSGNIFGTTYYGGANNEGTVFELSPATGGGWTEQVIHSFGVGDDGGNAEAVTFFNGNLYGVTSNGGTGKGNVYELKPSAGGGWTEQLLWQFGGSNAPDDPSSPLTFDAAGNIYGVTEAGGTGLNGTVFKLTHSGGTWSATTLYNFSSDSTDGANPVGGLVLDTQGNLYGVTIYGGANHAGVVFEVTP